MELFLNCVWLVLGLSLLTAWSMHAWKTRSCPESDFLPSRSLQITALLLLIALLFPVISVTDDFAMCTAPRDAERAMRLHDTVEGSQPFPIAHPTTFALHQLLAFVLPSGPSWHIEPQATLGIQLAANCRVIETRPPPVLI